MQQNWNKEEIYTVVGHFNGNREFITLDNEILSVATYRIIIRAKSDGLVAINLKWNNIIQDWVAFQLVELES